MRGENIRKERGKRQRALVQRGEEEVMSMTIEKLRKQEHEKFS